MRYTPMKPSDAWKIKIIESAHQQQQQHLLNSSPGAKFIPRSSFYNGHKCVYTRTYISIQTQHSI